MNPGAPFHVELEGQRGGVEIRCCCNPAKLYGWLTLNGEPRVGQRFRFALPPNLDDVGTVTPGGEVLLEVSVVTLGSCSRPPLDPRGFAREPLDSSFYDSHPALRYEGDDLTFTEKARRLLHVPGYEPSPEARAALGVAPASGMVWP
jgi:hypothetical protein